MAHIAALQLSVSEPETLAAFYCDVLGMRRLDAGEDVAVGYGGDQAALVLKPGTGQAYAPDRYDRYWKIALTVPNLDLAHAQLCDRDIELTDPHQFRDIAYMSHLADPEGFVIELLQHTFAGEPRTSDGNADLPLGGGACLGLITLRTSDLDAELASCKRLGLHRVSRQRVSDFGFDLHFFAGAHETRPLEDLDAVENRPWLWQRPYTVLEFQHRLDGAALQTKDRGALGSATVVIDGDRGPATLR